MDGEPLSCSEQELLAVAHRAYTQAYASGENHETVHYQDSQSKGEYEYIADVEGSEKGYAYAQMRNRFKNGDVLEVLSPDSNFGKSFMVEYIQTSKGEETDDAKLVQEIYKINCPYTLKKGDYLRRKRI